MATSANNFNYIQKNGQKLVHTISPYTGYPIVHNLLSASVITNDCALADAYATAFMVLGLEKSKSILEQDPALSGFLIFSNPDGSLGHYASSSLTYKIVDDQKRTQGQVSN